MRLILPGTLLIAAFPLLLSSQTLAEPAARGGKLRWFTLTETPRQVRSVLGPPSLVAESGSHWIAQQYRLGDAEHDDFSHQLLFERGTAKLLSVTRNYTQERDVSSLFPANQTKLHYYPNAEHPQMTLRMRLLPNGLVLTALGSSGLTSQLVLLRREFVPELFPWLPAAAATAPSR